MITRIAPAKINLSLHITGRRQDGYHMLDSVMCFTEWGDVLTLTPASDLTMTAEGSYAHLFQGDMAAIDPHSPNLIAKAVYLMASHARKIPQFHIHVVKNIPAGAGLGGASADAAAVMHMLNEYWQLGLSLETLCDLGLRLGAELPVCLHGHPSHVRGIGETVHPVPIPELPIVIAWPDTPLATQDVFECYRHAAQPFSEPVTYSPHNFDAWLQAANNDLTGTAIELCPAIGNILSYFHDCTGIRMARMSGSGSACLGIFDSHENADRAAATFPNATATKNLT